MTDRREAAAVDTHAVVDLASGFAVVGYALFAYQQPGNLNVLRPIQRVDVDTPVAELVREAVAARYDEGAHETVVVEVETVVEAPVAVAPAPAPVDTAAPAPAAAEATHFDPGTGDAGYVPATVEYAFEEEVAPVVEQVVVSEEKRISAPTLSWDPEIWKPAAEKEAALKRLGMDPGEGLITDDGSHAGGIAYDEPEPEPTPAPEPVQEEPYVPAGPPAARSTVSMLQELSFLDD